MLSLGAAVAVFWLRAVSVAVSRALVFVRARRRRRLEVRRGYVFTALVHTGSLVPRYEAASCLQALWWDEAFSVLLMALAWTLPMCLI